MTGDRKIDPSRTTRRDIPTIAEPLLRRASQQAAATLHEASGRQGALPCAIHAIHPEFAFAGRAVTVSGPPGDNLWLHRAIYAAEAGDVLVVEAGQGYDFGYWGEVMSTAARARGLAGLVIDGSVRDSDLLKEIGFPVFARGLSIKGTGKDFGALGWINHSVAIGDVVIEAGDLIVGDADGVVAVAHASIEHVVTAAEKREGYERDLCRKLEGGATTLDLFGWDQ